MHGRRSVVAFMPVTRDAGVGLSLQEALAAAKPPATVCGKVLDDGDAVFSCVDCGADPTCIMCSACFENSEHRFHNYQMASSGGGGYCDCGDAEAWSSGHTCSLHTLDAGGIPSLPEAFASHAFEIITSVTADAVDMLGRTSYIETDAAASLAHPTLRKRRGTVVPAESVYGVMLHNDATHSFDDVIAAVCGATQCTFEEATCFANDADRNGRALVFTGSRQKCRSVAQKMSMATLTARFQRVQLIQEQMLLSQLFAWLAEIAALHPSLQEATVNVLLAKPLSATQAPPLETVFRIWNDLPEGDREALRDAVLSPLLLAPEWKRRFGLELFRQYAIVHDGDTDEENALGTWTVQVRRTMPFICHLFPFIIIRGIPSFVSNRRVHPDNRCFFDFSFCWIF
jgi:E3 ubiquitin-protein ligase UBR2